MGCKTYWFIFKDNYLLLKKDKGGFGLPFSVKPPVSLPKNTEARHTGCLNKAPCSAFYIGDACKDPKGFVFTDLRDSFNLIDSKAFWQAGKSFQTVYWDIYSKYCPKCGVLTKQGAPNSKICPVCQREFFPPVSPAIMALVRKGDSVLLIRGKNFRRKFYALVAGFIEPGETPEECVKREVFEETNIKVKNIRYFGSRPWPFPSNLMLGFTADYESGSFKPQLSEVLTGGFFTLENLPPLPGKISLSRKMIDSWKNQQKKPKTAKKQ